MPDQTYTDAIALLKADHRTVEDLFAQYEGASGASAKKKLAHRICVELKIHTALEERFSIPPSGEDRGRHAR
jgi:ATP-dependent phosphoenolpyruvate carboxykinase